MTDNDELDSEAVMTLMDHLNTEMRKADKENGAAIGIDLGTTYSCVAVHRKNKAVETISVNGHHIVPSYVAFTESECLVGNSAKKLGVKDLGNIIYDVKRLIGRSYDDPVIQEAVTNRRWPFKIINDENIPKIKAVYKDEEKLFSPEQISGILLNRLKEIAEGYLEKEVTEVVITVPANFKMPQRQATIDAGKIAGFKVIHILNEPTAAALSYGLHKDACENQKFLVYDLGGGTLDVSILEYTGNFFTVLSTVGDNHLGGQDFTNRLVDYCAEEFENQFKMSLNDKALHRLRVECETTKKLFSERQKCKIDVNLMGKDFEYDIERDKFDTLNMDLFKKTIVVVKSALIAANLTETDEIEIVLVGGSTRILKIQELLKEQFVGKALKKSVDVDEAVARGAAISAAVLHEGSTMGSDGLMLQDVIPFSLGIRLSEDRMKIIIHGNSRFPKKMKTVVRTLEPGQKNASVKIFEGENDLVTENTFLGEFILTGLHAVGRANIQIRFDINKDGMLKVSAWEMDTKEKNGRQIEIDIKNGRLNKEEIERMADEVRIYGAKGEKGKDAITARNELKGYCIALKTTLLHEKLNPTNLPNESRKFLLRRCERVMKWCADHPFEEEELYESVRAILDSMVEAIITNNK